MSVVYTLPSQVEVWRSKAITLFVTGRRKPAKNSDNKGSQRGPKQTKHPAEHTRKINFTAQHLVLGLVGLLCECPQVRSLMLEEPHREDIRQEQIRAGAVISCSSPASPQHLQTAFISEALMYFVALWNLLGGSNKGAYNKGNQISVIIAME